eukprot:CAMPEP_0185265616 /NCGR_PEP_ID=MMETSP1359-20130426/28189_1 /TAXON_ID=552665 /ORGANISM="Bigelowiella longifila, Strain CCMP242" /LENGTH=200 /DNA_ID=CAMNT_0027854997 /DNA_START=111 /DNA_END=713 /DNA_ORIENTATION=+
MTSIFLLTLLSIGSISAVSSIKTMGRIEFNEVVRHHHHHHKLQAGIVFSRRAAIYGGGTAAISLLGNKPGWAVVNGIAEARLEKALFQLRRLQTPIANRRYREAREALREGSLSHLREDVREAMARHPVRQEDAKAAINSLLSLDNTLRKAERGNSVALFPSLIEAIDQLEVIVRNLEKEGSLYGEEFTNPLPLKKRYTF